MEVALKVDVDTHRGLKLGVPRLARLLEREGVPASFFVAMGPDNSGRALLRIVRNRGFLSKMFRTRAVSTYGLRTVLSGTLMPARPVGTAFPETMRALKEAGFELGVHGYDHVRWQDRIERLEPAAVARELDRAFEGYRQVLGEPAQSFAAPGWRTSATALELLDRKGLLYRSDTRGVFPFRCRIGRRTFDVPEIPTTLPTMDELMGLPGLRDNAALLGHYLARFSAERLNVHTIHAEVEGMTQLDSFAALLRGLKARGARFVRLCEVAQRLAGQELPVCRLERGFVTGRAGWVSVQGAELNGREAA